MTSWSTHSSQHQHPVLEMLQSELRLQLLQVDHETRNLRAWLLGCMQANVIARSSCDSAGRQSPPGTKVWAKRNPVHETKLQLDTFFAGRQNALQARVKPQSLKSPDVNTICPWIFPCAHRRHTMGMKTTWLVPSSCSRRVSLLSWTTHRLFCRDRTRCHKQASA